MIFAIYYHCINMCTKSQEGFNYFWSCLQSGTNLATCTCGSGCHKNTTQQNIWDQEKTIAVTTNISRYVSEDVYATYKDWHDFTPDKSFNWSSEIIDVPSGTKYTHTTQPYYHYVSNKNNAIYSITGWRYKYNDQYEKREGSGYTGGNEIMEKKYVTEKVKKTRTVYETKKTGGETYHDWVDVKSPTETYAFANNRIVGYNYNPYTTKKEYVKKYTPVREERIPKTETYYENETKLVDVGTGRYTEVKRMYDYPVLTEYKMSLYKTGSINVSCQCLLCNSFISEIEYINRDATDDTCLVCSHTCHNNMSYCNKLKQGGVCCPCSVCRCVKCIEKTIGPDNCIASFFGGKDRQKKRIVEYILKNVHPYKYLNEYLYSEGGMCQINVGGKNLYVNNIIENTIARLR